jgi:hypothetical protein
MTLLERANAITNPVTRREMVTLVHECHEAMLEAIEIPNELLADEYQNKTSTNEDTQREAFQPLSVLIERLEREELAANPPMSEHEKLKAITTERADRYAYQFATCESFEYEVDEDRLYRNQLAFANAIGIRFEIEDEFDAE